MEPTPQANRAPSFDEGANTTRSVAENTEAGQDIGLPLAATDPDSDSLTYALGGADSGHFALSGNRLQTSGALDYEGQNSYSVTVNVSDGNGGSDTTAVTITVTNVNEPPGALPGLAVFEEVNGIRVSWSAPDMTGKPPITGYDVQYKLVTATDWNDHSHSGTGTTIQGLTAGSTYNVRVRAKNDEGNSVWARAQTTPTAPPVTPVPPGAITNLEVTPGWSKLGLTWNMPDMTGKPPITHYEVQYKLSIDKYWGDFPHDSTVRRVTIDFLGGGLSYDVRVRASNTEGWGPWSDAAVATTAGAAPAPAEEESDAGGAEQESESADYQATAFYIQGQGRVILQWDEVSKSGYYTIERNGRLVPGNFRPTTHYDDYVEKNTRYEYRITA